MKPVILIADDDDNVRGMLGRLLESEGFNVVFAKNGTQALFEFLIMPFDLALLDVRMPGADGWEVFEALGRLHPRMPILVMTGLPYQQPRARIAGVDGFLEKPLDPTLLLQTIRLALSRHNPARAVQSPRETAPVSKPNQTRAA